MKPFRERNPVVIGAISLVVIAVMIIGAFRADDLPLIGGGDTYYAAFEEAGGLKVNDPVRIAGVRVGEVDSVELDDGAVKVGFKIETDARLGEESQAEIKVQTILGQMFLAVVPAGDGELAAGRTIPVERTTSPYDVVDAFTGLAETSEEIDTDRLADALTTLSDLTRDTPAEFRSALKGLSSLSKVVVARDQEINSLLQNTQRVSRVLDDRDEDIVGLMEDADVLFRALVSRRQAVHRLLTSATTLSKEMTKLVKKSEKDLSPALKHLENVLDVLNKNEDDLDESLRVMAPFARVFAGVLGTGPWWDTYIYNLPPVPGNN